MSQQPVAEVKAEVKLEPAAQPADADFTNVGVQFLMAPYYSRLFPHQEVYKWLAYGNDGKHPMVDASFFQHREFCFTLDGDIFVRYQSFKDGLELAAALKDRCPSKIDIGPVYNVEPQRRAAYQGSGQGFCPLERELVFDIDLTDYDDVRTCGKDGHICIKCWPLMAAAIKILDAGLRQDFGFQHILFVFSGRRGVHCWVCDERARKLTDEQRSAIASYFAVYKGQERGVAKLALGLDDHPALARAYALLKGAFEDRILPEQGLLEDEAQRKAILAYLPNDAIRNAVERRWDGVISSADRWEALQDEVETEAQALEANRKSSEGARAAKAMRKAVKDIVCAYTYPRLDMEVSKKMNHLLKAPFCVHPKTGKVCVPIDPEAAWEFDPETVCTVGGLLNQLNSNSAAAAQGEEPWRATDMSQAVETFRACFLDALQAEVKEGLAEKSRQAAAAPTLACSNMAAVVAPPAVVAQKPQVVASTITAMPRLTKAATFVAAGTVAILLSGPPALAADLVLGEEVFNNNCAACHMGGNNSVQNEKTLRKSALEQYLAGGFNQDAIVYQVENGKNAMPAWADRLDEDEIQAVAAFVFSQASGDLW
ncbi:DNA primase small subunit [Chlorella vulgaris]